MCLKFGRAKGISDSGLSHFLLANVTNAEWEKAGTWVIIWSDVWSCILHKLPTYLVQELNVDTAFYSKMILAWCCSSPSTRFSIWKYNCKVRIVVVYILLLNECPSVYIQMDVLITVRFMMLYIQYRSDYFLFELMLWWGVLTFNLMTYPVL